MRVTVHSTVGRLADDFAAIAKRAPKEFNGVVRDGVKAGDELAKNNARRTAGRHGKRYPASMSWQMTRGFSGFGTNVYAGEYGPDASRPQGGMEFEQGSRNSPPHNDLARSADVVGPQLQREARQALDRLFD